MQDSERYLKRALKLAARGRYGTSPNPLVGAILVRDGEVVGEGYHRRVGGPHAEREALAVAGPRARGATLYVTLEPCAHHGRTPPCADAVLEAGVARVVACHGDPDPRVAGGGFELLRRAGVEVESGWLAEEAVRLNHRFLLATILRRPAVTLKWAMSLDGKIATRTGKSQWISSPAARRWALDLREEHDAILVGSGTALADDPRLSRRPPRGARGRARDPNIRVILDRRLRLAPSARLFEEEGPVLVYTREAHDRRRRQELEARGATVVAADGGIAAVLEDLYQRGVRGLLVEGGAEIHAAFVADGFWDRVLVDFAPLMIGGTQAPGPVAGLGVAELAEAPRLDALRTLRRGDDTILEGFRAGCLEGLVDRVRRGR